MPTASQYSSYEEAVAAHEWQVPDRYNIAADVCDKHPADKLAMIHEDVEGNVREVHWGELQELSNRFANVLRAHGVEQGDRVAMLLPPTPETAAAFFGTYKSGAILLSMSVLYGDDGIRHRLEDSGARFLVTDADHAAGRAGQDRILALEAVGRGEAARRHHEHQERVLPAVAVGRGIFRYRLNLGCHLGHVAANDGREISVDHGRVAATDQLDQGRDFVANRHLREAGLARERSHASLMLGISI